MARAQPYNREIAIDTAQLLFWKKGYHATSMSDLQTALQMKPGSIYAAFQSKEKLFCITLERYFFKNREEFIAGVIEAASPLDALADNLRSLGMTNQTNAACHACMLIKTILNATNNERAIANRARKYLDLMEAEMAKAFGKAIALGELPATADSKRLARRYQSDVTALRIEAHRRFNTEELAQSAEDRAQAYEAMRIGHTK
ncbi:MAG: helix-turn-helix domain-containing protein [Pseudomonadota bacterium]